MPTILSYSLRNIIIGYDHSVSHHEILLLNQRQFVDTVQYLHWINNDDCQEQDATNRLTSRGALSNLIGQKYVFCRRRLNYELFTKKLGWRLLHLGISNSVYHY